MQIQKRGCFVDEVIISLRTIKEILDKRKNIFPEIVTNELWDDAHWVSKREMIICYEFLQLGQLLVCKLGELQIGKTCTF